MNARRPARTAALAAAVLFASLLAACSAKPPLVSRVFARVVYSLDAGTGERAETLGVFLVASDPDGMEDLAAYYVINDDAELFWKVESGGWTSAIAEGESWIGTSSLSMPDGGPFPTGRYRVVLQSVGGETAEDAFTLPARAELPSAAAFPKATVQEGVIRVTGAPGGCEVWAYGGDGALTAVYPLPAASPTLAVSTVMSAAPTLAKGFTFRVFTWDAQAGHGTLAGPWQAP